VQTVNTVKFSVTGTTVIRKGVTITFWENLRFVKCLIVHVNRFKATNIKKWN